ncbi:ABC transporter permease [Arsenicicoccus piscis]|uniref:Xylose transport system permease protein XylH n=1 Tax=Arsenicicoccus piscis TaxID=673954 RepID=A0ABQ6HVR4_9MICO|nr:ABC transporter permease [Arsenicicoccus piscis]MCH8627467.1 ABC transporter permease [Arsenicicoccus piscis]GMA21634.1 ribose ABC transporter permease [Arsenicicoccus piscis]
MSFVDTSAAPPATPPAQAKDDRVQQRSFTGLLFSRPEIGALVGAIVVAALFLAVAPAFRSVNNVGTILYSSAAIGIVAVAVSMLMIGGEFDLSAGVAATTSGITAALSAWNLGLNVWVGVLIALIVSLAIGAFNGWLLMRTGLPSFLVTLGTFFVLQGVNLGVTRLITGTVATARINDMDGFNSAAAVFGSEFTIDFRMLSLHIGPIQVKSLVIFWIVLTIITAYVLQRTKIGNWVYAVGGDADAARAVGVPVKATKIGLFMFVGFCCWVLGMHLLFEYSVVQSGEGVGKEFIFIIAAVVGGCLMTGGYGSVIGAALGALIFGMTQLGINYAGWNVDWFYSFLGVMLIGAVLVNMYVKKKADAR